MPKVVKKRGIPERSVSEERKKFRKSSSGSTVTDQESIETLSNKSGDTPPIPKENVAEARQKFLDMMDKQIAVRENLKMKMIRTLSAIVDVVEADLLKIREGANIFTQRTINHLLFLDQTITAACLRLKALKCLLAAYKTKFDEFEKKNEQNVEVCEEFMNDMKELQDSLVAETRNAFWKTLHKSLYESMHKEI